MKLKADKLVCFIFFGRSQCTIRLMPLWMSKSNRPQQNKAAPAEKFGQQCFCPLYIAMLSFGPKPTRGELVFHWPSGPRTVLPWILVCLVLLIMTMSSRGWSGLLLGVMGHPLASVFHPMSLTWWSGSSSQRATWASLRLSEGWCGWLCLSSPSRRFLVVLSCSPTWSLSTAPWVVRRSGWYGSRSFVCWWNSICFSWSQWTFLLSFDCQSPWWDSSVGLEREGWKIER